MAVKKKVRRLSREEIMIEKKRQLLMIIFAVVVALISFVIYGSFISIGIALVVGFLVAFFTSKFMISLKNSARVKKIEDIFPDFLQLVSSNLRAGMTVDRAILLSSRPEFAPLDKEILRVGKDISTGKPVGFALGAMSKRIESEKIDKTLSIILSGIRAGGNLAVLLEETSRSMRQRTFIEKKASSQVLMYVIFIFLAVSLFSPGLFSLSGVLVNTMTQLMSGVDPSSLPQNLPISFTSINISSTFIFYFSLFFMIIMNVMASLVLGLVSKGDEKEGLRYLPIMIILSLAIFFILRSLLGGVMSGFIR